MKDFRLNIKIRNNRMVERREALGLSAPAFAEKIQIRYPTYLDLENMKRSPVNKRTGQLTENAIKIMIGLGATDEELWPDQILAIKKNTIEKRYDFEEMMALSGRFSSISAMPQLNEYRNDTDVRKLISETKTLTSAQLRRLLLYFGIDCDQMSMSEIAEKEGVTRGVVDQTINRALEKIRRQSKIKPLDTAG